jgi:hypothetical protein
MYHVIFAVSRPRDTLSWFLATRLGLFPNPPRLTSLAALLISVKPGFLGKLLSCCRVFTFPIMGDKT